METVIIAGYGEIGKAIGKLEGDFDAFHFSVVDPYQNIHIPPVKADVLHICFPYGKDFVKSVVGYMLIHCPKITIIHSTVAVGTTAKIAKHGFRVVHSPVRGTHPDLVKGILTFPKFVAGPKESAVLAIKHLKKLGMTCVWQGKDYKTTELAKLLDTTYYGWNIAFADKTAKLCKKYGVEYDYVYREWNETYNLGYLLLGKANVIRPTLNPPEGGIGGHCVTSNAILLREDMKPQEYELADVILSEGFKTPNKETYKNRDWLYCEYIGKKRTTYDIAKECKVSQVGISQWLKKHGIPARHKAWSDEERNLLVELSEEMSFKDIADLGVLDRTYNSIRTRAIFDNIQSKYNPAIRDLDTRKKISCTLQDIDLDSFEEFKRKPTDIIRKSEAYTNWRLAVFKRDNYTCQAEHCPYCENKRGGTLHAHHIKEFSKYPKLRFTVSNGITYCSDYHIKLGKKHGKPTK